MKIVAILSIFLPNKNPKFQKINLFYTARNMDI